MPPSARQQSLQVSVPKGAEDILTPEAAAFLERLHDRFEPGRRGLLLGRDAFDHELRAGRKLRFRPDTLHLREAPWRVAPVPPALERRVVEITGPVDRKMMVNALNSGADVFMADLEDSHSPMWDRTLQGYRNIRDAVHGRLVHDDPGTGRHYEVGPDPALMVVRVRGLHLDEPALQIGGRPVSAALADFALTFFHNAHEWADRRTGPFYYLPKLEHAEEARWWAEVFTAAERSAGLPHGTIKATVLVETLPAAFEMDEILHALRDHGAGLNAGRWDYIFSCIKTLRDRPEAVLPDRAQVTMDVPFMRCYSELLVKTCHRRGAYAIGGMSAYIPSADPEQNARAFEAIQEDKRREARAGFDGTWVAHPGLVELARAPFERTMCGHPNQLHRLRGDVEVDARRLLAFGVPEGRCTDEGLSKNVEVSIRYLDAWLRGRGAVAIDGLMEDAATAEISRSQVWQWLRHRTVVGDAPLTRQRVEAEIEAALQRIAPDSEHPAGTRRAASLFAAAVLAPEMPPFLTTVAQPYLEESL